MKMRKLALSLVALLIASTALAMPEGFRQLNGMALSTTVEIQDDAVERGGSFYVDRKNKTLVLYPWQDGSTDVLRMFPVGLEYDGPMVETPYGWKIPLKNHVYGATFLQLVDLQSARVPDALENYLGNGVALIYSGMPVANIPQGEWIPKRIAFSGMVDDCTFTIQDPANFLPDSTYPAWVPWSIDIRHNNKRNSGGHHRYTNGKIAQPPRPIAIGWSGGQITGWAYGKWRQVGPYIFDKVFFRDAQFDADMTRNAIGNPVTVSVSADLGYTTEPSAKAGLFTDTAARLNGGFNGVGDVTLDSVSYWGDTDSTGLQVAGAVYDENATPAPVNVEGDTGNVTLGTITGKTLITIPAAGTPAMTLSPGTNHAMGVMIDTAGTRELWYDTPSPSTAYRLTSPYNFTTEVWATSPTVQTLYTNTFQWGMYFSYTPAAATPVTTLAALTDITPTRGDSTTLSATITDGDNTTTAAEYFVGTDPGEGSGTSATLLGGSSPFTISEAIDTTSLDSGAYTVSVRGFSSDGWGAVDTVGMTVVLGEPQNFAGEGGDTIVTLTWDEVTGATSYDISWGTAPSTPGGNLGTVGPPPKVHTGRTNGVEYYYNINAVDGGGASTTTSNIFVTAGVAPTGDGGAGLNLGIGLEL